MERSQIQASITNNAAVIPQRKKHTVDATVCFLLEMLCLQKRSAR